MRWRERRRKGWGRRAWGCKVMSSGSQEARAEGWDGGKGVAHPVPERHRVKMKEKRLRKRETVGGGHHLTQRGNLKKRQGSMSRVFTP